MAGLLLCLQTLIIFLILTLIHGQRREAYTLADDYCPENCFCPRLEEVWCKNVPMTGISDRMWPTLENLTIINAELERLTSNMFSRYKYLKRLHLESANIRQIDRDAFAGLPRLHLLRLFGNKIDRLDAWNFAQLNHVKEIYLTDNHIKSIGKNAFFSASNIGTLDLRNNPGTKLESGAFNGLTHVERLLLPTDMIDIEAGAFDNLTNVHYLEIRQWKPKDSDSGGIEPHTFRGLRDVKTLQIEKSHLGVLHPHAFDGLTNVENLYIRNSFISRIRKRSFIGMRHVRRLGLTKNIIDHIDYMTLFADRTSFDDEQHQQRGGDGGGDKIQHTRRHFVRQLDMNKNQLNCTCPKNAWILYEEQIVQNHSSILRNNTCFGPSDLEKIDLYTASIRVKDLKCDYVDDSESGGEKLASLSWMTSILSLGLVLILRREQFF